MRLLLRLAITWVLCSSISARAQATSATQDAAITDHAGKLVHPLSDGGNKRVLVMDLRGPQKEIHPVGKWLADHLTSAIQQNFSEVEAIDRTQIGSYQAGQDEAAPDRV